ncbi:MAG TPA: pilus assembly protein TadG-related protein [Terracidiphilus sp.]|nr:pilus assembly protein TadG-related protein [Terracidiphilus sp.]
MRSESGQALVLTAMSLSALMGVMALAIDVGNIQYRETQLQTAADSAALAAGLELGNCSDAVCSNMETAAEKALIEDGITSSTVAPSVNVCSVSSTSGLGMIINVAPCMLGASDPNKGNTHMAEVVLTQPQPTIFGRLFGIPTMNLVARAEAGDAYVNSSGGGNCIWTNGLQFNSSNGAFNLTGCGIYDNGNLQTDNGDSVTSTSTFLYYGSWSPNNCNSSCTWSLGDSETQPTHTTSAQSDPLASLTAPSQPAASTTASDTAPNSGTTLQPGYYANGINLNSNVTVNLTPGLYYMNGSINVDSGATLECTTCTSGKGVTLYFVNGSFQPNSGATVTLSAPTTDATSNAVANMLIWQSSSNSSGMDMDASTTVTLNGIIYLPDATLTLNSGSGTTINAAATSTAVDAQDIIVDSDVTFDVNGSGGLLGGGSGQTLGSFALAE